MKVLGIQCSARKRGNCEILLEEAFAGARERGAETETLAIADYNIRPCDGCYSCIKTGKCHIKDDMQAIYPKLEAADIIIFSTPVFFLSVPGSVKTLIDRSYVLYHQGKLANKVGGTIVVGSSMGHVNAWTLLELFFSLNHMRAADYVYGFARDKGDIRKDKHAMIAAKEQGKMVVALAAQGIKHPEEWDTTLYRYVRSRYGVDMCPSMGRFESEAKA